jgi:serine/threonine protein kinase
MADDLLRSPAESASALPAGTRLGEFEVLSLLGVGGFGIVYLAFDHQLEREVAVKEYMPASMAGRTETMHVSLRSKSDAEIFALGLRSFVNEAKLLARFDHPSLIKVHRFWEANGTAYMAMPVLRGRTLKEIRQGRQSLESPIDERWLRGLLEPLLGALELLHGQGVYHRDIAPDNIQVESDGRPVLLDFGAARRVIIDKTQTLTAILKPAYAPIEQYAEAGGVKQGPWTDLYSLGATLHYMLLARPPEPATARAVSDDAAPLASQKIEGCGESFLHTVDWMLAPRPADRPQSVAALRAVLGGKAPLPQRRPVDAVSAAQWEPTLIVPPGATPPQGAKPVPPVAPQPPDDNDITVVVAPKPPPARRATPGHPASPPPQPAPAQAASPAPGPGPTQSTSAPARPAVPEAAPAAERPAAPHLRAAASGGSRLVFPVALGVVVVAAAAAFALWPRSSGDAAAPPPATSATPPTAGGDTAPAVAKGSQAAPPVGQAAPAAAPAAPIAPVTPPPSTAPAPQAAAEPVSPAPSALVRPADAAPPVQAAPKAPPSKDAAAPAARPTQPTAAPSKQPPAAPPAEPSIAPPSPSTAAAPGPAPATPAPTRPEAAAPALVGPLPEPSKPKGPEAQCGNRNPLSYFVCMERECRRSEFKAHPECVKWHQQASPRD